MSNSNLNVFTRLTQNLYFVRPLSEVDEASFFCTNSESLTEIFGASRLKLQRIPALRLTLLRCGP
jgi:hypothetical protein